LPSKEGCATEGSRGKEKGLRGKEEADLYQPDRGGGEGRAY